MDPNLSIAMIRSMIHTLRTNADAYDLERLTEDVSLLCEVVESLDHWLARGGFLPRVWQPERN